MRCTFSDDALFDVPNTIHYFFTPVKTSRPKKIILQKKRGQKKEKPTKGTNEKISSEKKRRKKGKPEQITDAEQNFPHEEGQNSPLEEGEENFPDDAGQNFPLEEKENFPHGGTKCNTGKQEPTQNSTKKPPCGR